MKLDISFLSSNSRARAREKKKLLLIHNQKVVQQQFQFLWKFIFSFLLLLAALPAFGRQTFLFVNGISWNFPKTSISMSLECMQSFIEIGGVVSEKKSNKKHTDYWIYY